MGTGAAGAHTTETREGDQARGIKKTMTKIGSHSARQATSTLSRRNRASAFSLRAMDGPSPKTALAPTYSSRKFLAKKTCTATAVASIAMSDGQATDKTEPATRW